MKRMISVLLSFLMVLGVSSATYGAVSDDGATQVVENAVSAINGQDRDTYSISTNAVQSDKVSSETTVSTSGTSKTVTASKAMGLVLDPGESGYSNTITFNFNSLPANAIVEEIKVDASHVKILGGLGVIVAQKLRITDPLNNTKEVAWGQHNVTTTTSFISRKAKGTWSVSYYGTNIASSGAQFYAGVSYSPVNMTITYVAE